MYNRVSMKLPRLHSDDSIAIAAPAGPFQSEAFQDGLEQLYQYGAQLFHRGDIEEKHPSLPYLAGSDERRLAELNQFLEGDYWQAILFARGGYGTQKLLPHLTKKIIPKIVVGSSDLTSLLLYLWEIHQIPSFYGPMVAPHLGRSKNALHLLRALTHPTHLLKKPLVAKEILKKGSTEGVLIGGCLTLILSSLGTPWEINTDNKILFLEDTFEEPYKIDRMLTQLQIAGKLKKIRGLVLGTFRLKTQYFPPDIKKVFLDFFATATFPILWGVRFGHHPEPELIPIGGKARIEGNQLILTENIIR